ncbi:winged helix-turn-helix domain-containing protein [Streptomyces albus]|uniref:winged helix-turn-helix domain-containing protein n=1 Tax=Streptomyces albus TaxID=1888 RepID=UPI003F1C49C5
MPTAPAQQPVVVDLAAAQHTLRSVAQSRYSAAPTAASRAADRLHALAHLLLPAARHRAAGAPPESLANLQRVIEFVETTMRARPRPHPGLEHIGLLTGHLRDLIRLLRQPSYEHEHALLAELVEGVTRKIAAKTYAPGAPLTHPQLCRDFDAPTDRVRSAVRLLLESGALKRVGNRLRVTDPDNPWQPLPEYVAQQMRERIADGDYREGQVLPMQTELARAFDVSTATIAKALVILHREGLLAWPRNKPIRIAQRPRRTVGQSATSAPVPITPRIRTATPDPAEDTGPQKSSAPHPYELRKTA